MKRTVIKIDETLCDGCGACVKGCHEGALQLINGKAVMISDLYCDGLGACIGECPVGAIDFEEREAEPYSEVAVMERLLPKGASVIQAHLNHLKTHGEMGLYNQGVEFLKLHNMHNLLEETPAKPVGKTPESVAEEPMACGCPGSTARSFAPASGTLKMAPLQAASSPTATQASELTHFPVQMHLIHPQAGFIQGADLLLAADCTAFACGAFHKDFLKGKVLAIACPKLDSRTEVYVEKLVVMMEEAKINTLTVMIMEVPCCSGLLKLAKMAVEQSRRKVPVKAVVVSVQGEIISNDWI